MEKLYLQSICPLKKSSNPKYIYINLKRNTDSMSKNKNGKWGCGRHLYLYIPLLKSNFKTKSFQWLYLSTFLSFGFFFFFELLQEWNSQVPQAEDKWETTSQQGWEALHFSLKQMYAPTVNGPRSRKGLVRPGKTRQSCINAANASKNIVCLNQSPYKQLKTH